MPYYAVYDQETGRLFSLGTEVSSPLPPEMGVVECGEECPVAAQWDPESRTFAEPVAEAVAEEEVSVPEETPPFRRPRRQPEE